MLCNLYLALHFRPANYALPSHSPPLICPLICSHFNASPLNSILIGFPIKQSYGGGYGRLMWLLTGAGLWAGKITWREGLSVSKILRQDFVQNNYMNINLKKLIMSNQKD
jgi:hypothetical protein